MVLKDDDPPARMDIDDVEVSEGDAGDIGSATFTVRLSPESGWPVAVNYATADYGTATEGYDYEAATGSLRFAPGETAQTITVTVNGDDDYESDETFPVALRDAAHATLARANGTGTIRNDDDPPPWSTAPALSAWADPNPIMVGEQSTLFWKPREDVESVVVMLGDEELETVLTATATSYEVSPPETTTYTLSAQDSEGAPLGDFPVTLTVLPRPPTNGTPTVSAACDPCEVAPGGEVGLSATASDPDGDPLTYAWSAPRGGFDGATDAATARWTAPAQTGPVTIRVRVSDGRGGTASAEVAVEITNEITRERLRRVNEAILPELSRAMVSGAVKEVARRIKEADPHAPTTGNVYTVAGYSDISGALIANREALNEGTMGWKRALAGSSFALGLGGGNATPGNVTLWGEGDWRELKAGGEKDPVEFDGGVLGLRLGLDAQLGDDLLAGVALSWTQSAFDNTDRGEAGHRPMDGKHESRMTSVYPYVGWWPGQDVGLWGTVGYGVGEVEIDDEAGAQSSDGALIAAGLGGHMRLFSEDDVIEGGARRC